MWLRWGPGGDGGKGVEGLRGGGQRCKHFFFFTKCTHSL